MGRDAQTPTAVIDVPDLSVAHLQEIQQMGSIELDTQQAHVRAIALQVGYQLPGDMIDPDLIQRDIASNMRRSVEACLEVGRGLAVLKASCEHGQFTARLDILGIETSVARRFMQTATKFSNRASTHVLKAAGNQTKLFEMLILDDEQIEELELTGQTGELKLDAIATMSVKELRATLRETTANLQAKEKNMADKNSKVDELTEKLERSRTQIQALPAVEVGELIRAGAVQHFSKLEVQLRAMKEPLQALAQHGAEHGLSHDEFAAGLVAQLQFVLNQLRTEFDLKATPDGEVEPDWLRDEADEALAKFQRQQTALPLDGALNHGSVLNPIEG